MNSFLSIKIEQAEQRWKRLSAFLLKGLSWNFVMTTMYYAFLYPILELLKARRIAFPTRMAAIAQFEREFVDRAFWIKNSCTQSAVLSSFGRHANVKGQKRLRGKMSSTAAGGQGVP